MGDLMLTLSRVRSFDELAAVVVFAYPQTMLILVAALAAAALASLFAAVVVRRWLRRWNARADVLLAVGADERPVDRIPVFAAGAARVEVRE